MCSLFQILVLPCSVAVCCELYIVKNSEVKGHGDQEEVVQSNTSKVRCKLGTLKGFYSCGWKKTSNYVGGKTLDKLT